MATVAPTSGDTVADLLRQLGDVPPERVRLHPTPGTATEQDVLDIEAKEDRLCELVDGVLVEKPMGYMESRLALTLAHYIESYLEEHDIGIAAGADGMLKLNPGLVRIPDVSFIAEDRLPGGATPKEPIPAIAPDLAVEILSESNTRKEMSRKLREYFDAGCRLVWYVDPKDRTVRVYTSVDDPNRLTEEDMLDGGAVLPSFQLSIRKWFQRAERRQA